MAALIRTSFLVLVLATAASSAAAATAAAADQREQQAAAGPDPGHVLADAKSAFTYANTRITTKYSCNWERGTYMIGLWSYFAVSRDPVAKAYLQAWGQNYKYKLCCGPHGCNATAKSHHHPGCPTPPPPPPHGAVGGPLQPSRRRLQGACEHDSLPCVGAHNANNQLCGATYIELYKAGLD